MGLYRYRVFGPDGKLTAIKDSKCEAEAMVPENERRIVKRFQGRKMMAAYEVMRDAAGHPRWILIPKT